MKEIEMIKSGNIQTLQVDTSEVMDDEHKQVQDLIYALGFRKHQSSDIER